MDKKTRKELVDLCVEIFACCELDYEITLGGNGTNPFEAANVASSILDIIKVDRDSPEIEKLVEIRVKQLREDYGDHEDEDEDEDEGGEDEDSESGNNENVAEIPVVPVNNEEKKIPLAEPVKRLDFYREESEDDFDF